MGLGMHLVEVLEKPEKRQGKGITWSRAGSCGAWGTLQWHNRVGSSLAPSPWPGCPATGPEGPNADPMGLSPSWGPLTTSTATFPLPTVINKATTLSLQDPSRKITTSSCSTLPHHVHPTLPVAQPFGLMRTGGEATGPCTDSLHAASMQGELPQNKHPVLSSPPPCLQRNEIPQQTSLTLRLWVTPTSELVA